MTIKEFQRTIQPLLNDDKTSNLPVVIRAVPRKFKGLPLTEDRFEYTRDRETHKRYLKINAIEDHLRPNSTAIGNNKILSAMDLYITLEEIIADIGNVDVCFEYNISKLYGGLQAPQEVRDINPHDMAYPIRRYTRGYCIEIEAPMPEINKIQ